MTVQWTCTAYGASGHVDDVEPGDVSLAKALVAYAHDRIAPPTCRAGTLRTIETRPPLKDLR